MTAATSNAVPHHEGASVSPHDNHSDPQQGLENSLRASGRRDAATQHILPNTPAPKPKPRKRVVKPTLTLTPNPELVAIAKEHFANTRHGNITTWLNRALLRALRKDARRIRAAGIKIPEWLFLK